MVSHVAVHGARSSDLLALGHGFFFTVWVLTLVWSQADTSLPRFRMMSDKTSHTAKPNIVKSRACITRDTRGWEGVSLAFKLLNATERCGVWVTTAANEWWAEPEFGLT